MRRQVVSAISYALLGFLSNRDVTDLLISLEAVDGRGDQCHARFLAIAVAVEVEIKAIQHRPAQCTTLRRSKRTKLGRFAQSIMYTKQQHGGGIVDVIMSALCIGPPLPWLRAHGHDCHVLVRLFSLALSLERNLCSRIPDALRKAYTVRMAVAHYCDADKAAYYAPLL